ncbi:caspase-6-like isoform X2 [Diadema setosum]
MSSATDKSEWPEGSTSTTICAGSSNLDDIGYKSLKEVNDKAYDEGSSSWSCELVEFDDGGYQRRGNPDYADMFIGYATCEGYVSMRDPVDGSWFIQALCEELLAGAHSCDLSTIMNRVSRRINRREGQILREGRRKMHVRQATQAVFQGIEKKIYFLPKYPKE